jgi:hypothetical protein
METGELSDPSEGTEGTPYTAAGTRGGEGARGMGGAYCSMRGGLYSGDATTDVISVRNTWKQKFERSALLNEEKAKHLQSPGHMYCAVLSLYVFCTLLCLTDRLCGVVVSVMATNPEVPGSVPGAITFSE